MQNKLGEILLRLGYISETDIAKALTIQRTSGDNRKLGEILAKEFTIRDDQLQHALDMQQTGYMMDASMAIVTRVLRQGIHRSEIVRILKDLGSDGTESFADKMAEILEKVAAFINISRRLNENITLDSLLYDTILITTETLGADRGTLFLNDKKTGELFSRISQGGLMREIRFPNHMGIAGAVFGSGQPITIHDAYSSPMFNKEIDKETGYKTKNILCAPIKTRSNETVGVIQLLNKRSGDFDWDDLTLLEAITSQAAAALQNAQLFEAVQKAKDEETQLLDVTTAISSELKLEPLLIKIMETTTDILNADRSTLFLHDEKTNELWSLVAQGSNNVQFRFPSKMGIAGSVFTTGETINIEDAYSDPRFNQEFDKKSGYRTKTILCMPIVNKEGKTIGVTQVLNKKGGPFNEVDKKRLRAFSSQASIAIENARLFDDVLNMKNYNEGILESMNSGVITLDADHIIVKCNTAALRVLNIDVSGVAGQKSDDFFAGKNKWITDAINRVLKTGKSDITMDTEIFLADGGGVSINLNVVPMMNIKGEFIGALLIMEDITKEKRLKGTMARYMTKEVAERLLEGGETALGGQISHATVFFSDIRSFTNISERLGAQKTVSLLNEYFTMMVDIVFRYSGILDKYIGDAILAVFGIPFSTGDDAEKSVAAAIDMMSALREFNKYSDMHGGEILDIGIGINTAEVLAGNIGSLKRMDYTVIGDGVNLASRLEGANKYYGTKILISEFTHKLLKGDNKTRLIDCIKVKGKDEPVEIYEVLDYHDETTFPKLNEVVGIYSDAYNAYKNLDWDRAISLFEKVLAINKNDGPSKIYIERCNYFKKNPPAPDWDGAWVMTEK